MDSETVLQAIDEWFGWLVGFMLYQPFSGHLT